MSLTGGTSAAADQKMFGHQINIDVHRLNDVGGCDGAEIEALINFSSTASPLTEHSTATISEDDLPTWSCWRTQLAVQRDKHHNDRLRRAAI
ncbi:unnamed protein product [Strongylus vulgaris]|uniref:Uncharacterized protein n=1 Tax=Strongylus vulgaris TaxID=40348 RepID=A0A3P7KW16_STRVU|nr:unnamed protein product [Strongylus vulgaris]